MKDAVFVYLGDVWRWKKGGCRAPSLFISCFFFFSIFSLYVLFLFRFVFSSFV